MASLFAAILVCIVISVGAEFTANPPYYGQQYTTMSGARGMVLDDVGDILVLSRGANNIIAVWEDSNGVANKATIVNGNGSPGLNHGVAINGGYLYASSSSTVYRWSYVAGQRTVILTPPQVVVSGIPTAGHNTRTLVFDAQNRLYVSVGSNANVDNNSDRSRIRRFSLNNIPGGGIPFGQGEVFADGLRNEVGLAFDARGILWGVENGADNLNRPDIGGDIHNGNPAEEFNKFDKAVGTHYGYPYCFSTYNLPGYSAGTQFAWPSFMNDGVHTDAWCRNAANNNPPALAMGAHHAPLGVTFYDGRGCDSGNGAFPCSWTGDAIVAFHGSWNSNIKVGYRVARIPINQSTQLPTGEDINIVYENNVNCGSCFRPVNAIFNNKGHLIVSADANNVLYKVTYGQAPQPAISQA